MLSTSVIATSAAGMILPVSALAFARPRTTNPPHRGDTTMRSTFRAVTRSRSMPAVLAVAAVVAIATNALPRANPWGAGAGKAKVAGRYAEVNGIKLYYEIHGSGKPV